ncbi:Glutamate receptor 2.2 [Abeliophyllum distichum]|uniref:Glutamate receptor 2.2 n=1 Tax=Abeliophyllum distichum TaxID=126358 RepID=A0ABD1Q586_9LAMI
MLVLFPNAAVEIIGLETALEHKFLAKVLSPSITSSNEYPYVVKIRSDETSQFEGIASIVKSFEWNDVVLIYEEDTKIERKTIPHLAESLEGKNIHIPYRSVISLSSIDVQILKELQKLMTLKTKIYILDMSLSLACRLLVHAKSLGMMKEEYAWIITDKAMNSVHSMNFDVIESLQGTLVFKPKIAASSKLQNITSRRTKEYNSKNPYAVFRELPVGGVSVYGHMI